MQKNQKLRLLKIMVCVAGFAFVAGGIASDRMSAVDQKYVNYLQDFYTNVWTKPKLQLTLNPSVYDSLKEHKKSYSTYSQIQVINVEHVNSKTKRILYFYRSWYKGVYPQPYWATILKTKGKSQFKIVSLKSAHRELNPLLEKTFNKNYKKFKRLFIPKSTRSLTSLKFANDLIIQNKKPINQIYLNPIHFNDIVESDSNYYALYSIKYEDGVVGYLLNTPQCYGTPKTGLVLFVINEKNLEFNIFRDRSYFRSRILVRELNCKDGDEHWNTAGYFVDVNNDGYLDIVTKHVFKKHLKRGQFKTRTRYYKYTYRGGGHYRYSKISSRSFRRLVGNQ